MLKHIFHIRQQGNRKNIEDALFPQIEKVQNIQSVFLVCDGVGGESKGEEASRIVCEVMGSILAKQQGSIYSAEIIKLAAAEATQELIEYAEDHPEAKNMSTTLTLCCLQANGAWVAWCGDSRIYHIRDGLVLWRSKDHSLVQQLIDLGEISEEEAKYHPKKNIILRSLSAGNTTANIDTHFISDLRENDYILLCTDGILEQVGDKELFEILSPQQKENDKAKLFLNYCKDKTNDNYSMYLLHLGSDLSLRTKKKYFFKIAVIIIIIISIMGAVFLNYFHSGINRLTDGKIDDTERKTDSLSKENSIPLPQMPIEQERR